MTPLTPELLARIAPLEVMAVSLVMLVVPLIERSARHRIGTTLGATVCVVVACLTTSAPLGYAALSLAAFVHALAAWPVSRTGATTLLVAGLAAGAAAGALHAGQTVVAFGASLVSIALRAGVMPLHVGVAHLSERAPALQAQQFASVLTLVFLHLRFVDHHPAAYDAAATLVHAGSLAALVPALLSLVQRTLRGLYRSAVMVHGGMLIASVGAAGHGHYAAALLMAITTSVAVGGFGLMVVALEERAGPVALTGPGGRARAFPLLAGAFAFLGAAGVGMPGTAGFIADDLFLHALWEESVSGTTLVILASACLAIATLVAYARAFLGRQRASPAPDLLARERLAILFLVIVLVAVGVAPALVLKPAAALLGS